MRLLSAAFLILTPLSAVADDLCDELWLSRNMVFDRAGHCFGSELGKALFDNSDCTTSSPELDATGELIVAQVRGVEEEFSCSVDTSRTSLDVDQVDQRRALNDIPVRTGFESVCLDYNGPALLLTAGRHPDTAFFGEIMPGMDIVFLHIPAEGMDFVVLEDGGMGWVGTRLITPKNCPGGVAG